MEPRFNLRRASARPASNSCTKVHCFDVGSGRIIGPAVTLMTYPIAVGGFMHVVAGSMEAFLLVLNGDFGWWSMAIEFMLPVLLGNVIGGAALFALIAYAQVMKEI
jgi:formate/nitrite transporter FocA (FNT family)